MRFEHWLDTIPLRLGSLCERQPVALELDEGRQGHFGQKMEASFARGRKGIRRSSGVSGVSNKAGRRAGTCAR